MTEQEQRDEFMAAIVRLADDPEFRRSFMTHYRQWLYPPLLVSPDAIQMVVDMRPGSVIPVTEEQMRMHRAGELVFVAE